MCTQNADRVRTHREGIALQRIASRPSARHNSVHLLVVALTTLAVRLARPGSLYDGYALSQWTTKTLGRKNRICAFIKGGFMYDHCAISLISMWSNKPWAFQPPSSQYSTSSVFRRRVLQLKYLLLCRKDKHNVQAFLASLRNSQSAVEWL